MFRDKISNEARVLTLLVREGAAPDSEIKQSIQDDFSWNRFIKLADDHGVAGLIAPSVAELKGKGLVPPEVSAQVQTVSMGIAAASLRIEVELHRLLDLASSLDIPLIILKGAAVGNMLYDRPNARQAGDIDLLCKEADYTRLHDAMVDAGYTTDDERHLPSACSSLETAFEQHFRPADQSILIELHVDSIKLGVKPVHSDSIWDRAVPVEIGRSTAHSLSPRDLALMLPVHLHRHGFNRLAWFKDIDLLVRKYGDEIGWDQVKEDARAEGAGASLWLTFDLLREILDTPVPEGFVKSLKPSIFSRMLWSLIWPRKRVVGLEAVTRRRTVQFSITESWRGTLPSMVLMGRRREKLQILFSRIFKRRKTRKEDSGPQNIRAGGDQASR